MRHAEKVVIRNHFELDGSFGEYDQITGIDEAGRGCLAGPVVIASITWDPKWVSSLKWFPKMADSKVLKAETRETLYPAIIEAATRVRVAVVSPILVDYLNILKASLHGFEMVAPALNPNIPLLIDGNQKPPTLNWAATVVKGDSRVSAISAAGIVAKVTRDALMETLEDKSPGYGLAHHKGYATAAHRQALSKLGPGPWHRKSFRPVSDWDREGPADVELMTRFPADPKELLEYWRIFQAHYHHYSLKASRKAVERFRALGVLPSLNDKLGIFKR